MILGNTCTCLVCEPYPCVRVRVHKSKCVVRVKQARCAVLSDALSKKKNRNHAKGAEGKLTRKTPSKLLLSRTHLAESLEGGLVAERVLAGLHNKTQAGIEGLNALGGLLGSHGCGASGCSCSAECCVAISYYHDCVSVWRSATLIVLRLLGICIPWTHARFPLFSMTTAFSSASSARSRIT